MKFFHIADVHFGVENYGKIDPKTGIHTRLLDFSSNLEIIVEKAIAEDIDFLVFSGDAYKTAYPSPTQQKLLAQHLLRLQKANIPVVIIVGNHDHPLSFGKAHALDVFSYVAVDGFYVFSKPELATIQTKSGPMQIIGVPWPNRNHVVAHELHRFKTNVEIANYLSEKVGAIIASFAEQLDPKAPAILAGHLTVASGVFSGSEKCAIYGTDPLFLPAQLALKPLDYVALGHLHRFQDLNLGGIPIVYAGSIERVDFGERKEDKGFCRVTIDMQADGTKKCNYEFVQLPCRPMIQVEVEIHELADQTAQIVEALRTYNLDDAIVKIVYHLPTGAADKVNLQVIQRECHNAIYLVGVFPVRKVAVRERRAALKVDMDFTTLLSRYFESKETLVERKAKLIEKAFMLQHEVEIKDQESEG
jgi:DNA repair protein SbcD/Mre11